MNAVETIEQLKPKVQWSRSTVADGKWMQTNTFTPLSACDHALAEFIDNETSAREEACAALQAALDEETSARQNADSEMSAALNDEIAARKGADDYISGAFNEYVTNNDAWKESASAKIDTISAYAEGVSAAAEAQFYKLSTELSDLENASDVYDIVNDLGDLDGYVGRLTPKAIIKVMSGGENGDVQEYYRWKHNKTASGTWHLDDFNYVCSAQPYYNKAEADAMHQQLQTSIDTLSGDLAWKVDARVTQDFTTSQKATARRNIDAGENKGFVEFYRRISDGVWEPTWFKICEVDLGTNDSYQYKYELALRLISTNNGTGEEPCETAGVSMSVDHTPHINLCRAELAWTDHTVSTHDEPTIMGIKVLSHRMSNNSGPRDKIEVWIELSKYFNSQSSMRVECLVNTGNQRYRSNYSDTPSFYTLPFKFINTYTTGTRTDPFNDSSHPAAQGYSAEGWSEVWYPCETKTVMVDHPQEFTETEKAQARTNIGAGTGNGTSNVVIKSTTTSTPPTDTLATTFQLFTDGRMRFDTSDVGVVAPVPGSTDQGKMLVAGWAGSPGRGFAQWEPVPTIPNAVTYDADQGLNATQQRNARKNISAMTRAQLADYESGVYGEHTVNSCYRCPNEIGWTNVHSTKQYRSICCFTVPAHCALFLTVNAQLVFQETGQYEWALCIGTSEAVNEDNAKFFTNLPNITNTNMPTMQFSYVNATDSSVKIYLGAYNHSCPNIEGAYLRGNIYNIDGKIYGPMIAYEIRKLVKIKNDE